MESFKEESFKLNVGVNLSPMRSALEQLTPRGCGVSIMGHPEELSQPLINFIYSFALSWRLG